MTISVPSGRSIDTGDVGRTEVELRTIAIEERGVTAALFLASGCRPGPRTRCAECTEPGLAENLATLTISSRLIPRSRQPMLSPASASSSSLRNISMPVQTVFWVSLDTDDLELVVHMRDDATLNTAGGNGATAGDGHSVLDGHQERLVDVAVRSRDVGVHSVHELARWLLLPLRVALQGLQSGTADDRGVVAREARSWSSSSRTSISTSSMSSSSSTMSHLFRKTTM